MAVTRVVLDACAIYDLAVSLPLPSLEDRSLRQWIGTRKQMREDRVGAAFRTWLRGKELQGWEICIQWSAVKEAKHAYEGLVARATKGAKNGATVELLVKTELDEYARGLRTQSKICSRVSNDRFKAILTEVRNAFAAWDTRETRACIRRNNPDRPIVPEQQDIARLSEAISNKESSDRSIILATNDGHFVCHEQSISNRFGIRIHNYSGPR